MLKLRKTNPKIIKQINDPPFTFDLSQYISKYKNNGEKVKVCIAGTGTPLHCDFNDIKDMEVFDEKSKDQDDKFGYSTMVAGIMNADNPQSIQGIVPKSEIYFVKAFGDTGSATQQSLISSVLWSLIKEIDLLILCGEKGAIAEDLAESLTKASSNSMSILMTSGTFTKKQTAFSCKKCGILCISHKMSSKKGLSFEQVDDSLVVRVPRQQYYTTYAENCYVKPPPSIYSLGIVGGLLASIISYHKKNNIKYTTQSIYKELYSNVLN